jgi:hypothetical protein
MRLILAVIVAMMPLAAADKTPSQPAAKAQPAAPRTMEIPTGAVQAEDGWWRHTDDAGRKWLYRKTPFGVVRREDDGKSSTAATAASGSTAPAAAAGRGAVTVKATEAGDVVHFEKPGPFGVYRWDRRKSELSPDERGWLEAARNRGPEKSKQE